MSDWIKVEKITPRKPEVMMIAKKLAIHPDHAFGLCMRFWMWCDTHLANGKAEAITCDVLDAILEFNGIANALKTVGWIVFSDNVMRVSNFGKHMSENAKVRAGNNLRQIKRRENLSRSKRDKNVTKALPEREIEEDKEYNTPLPPTPRPPEPEEPFHAPEESMEEIEPEADLTLLWMHNRRGPAGGESHAKVLDFFREQLRLGKSFSAIKAAIENPTRNRTEFLWQFSRRELEDTNRTKNFESRKDCEQVMAEMMSDPNDRRLMEIAFNGAAKN